MLCVSFDGFPSVHSVRTLNRFCSLWVKITKDCSALFLPVHEEATMYYRNFNTFKADEFSESLTINKTLLNSLLSS